MEELLTDALRRLAAVAASKTSPVAMKNPADFVHAAGPTGPTMYENRNDKLNIDFKVERLAFPGIQTMDPRIVRIPPGKNNEWHRHAHESLFVILKGSGEVRIDEARVKVAEGSTAYVPRWLFHQSINTGSSELVILAITDFGFTSAVLGDYDRRTRLKEGGNDAIEG